MPQEIRAWLGTSMFQADLPELPELDNLFAPEGAIQEAQQLAAEAFGAEETWFLVNGSTAGVIASIAATCATGDKIILPRNVHRSAISGLILSGALPIFLTPEYDPVWDLARSITPESVSKALEEHPEAKAVMMVYPTYHGVCGDVKAIAQIAHEHGLPLLVDEAHGPHFAFHQELPTPALRAGADLSVQSIHKVLSAMTQASMLHVQGDRIDRPRLNQALQLMQSTSPSYLLLASLDAARRQMAVYGSQLMTQTLQLADRARHRIREIPGLEVLEPPAGKTPGFADSDRTRLTVNVTGLRLSGYQADEILHQQLGVTCELPSPRHVTFIISLGNTEADIEQLIQALRNLARDYCQSAVSLPLALPLPFPPAPFSPRDAFFAPVETVPVRESVDRVSAELVCPYPPGIPVLMPGEAIAPQAIEYLQQVLANGGTITGCSDLTLQTIKVVRDKDSRGDRF